MTDSNRTPDLLWPAEPGLAPQLSEEVRRDLGLAAIVNHMASGHRHRDALKDVLYHLCADPAAIRYRQAVLADLLRLPALAEALRALLPLLDDLTLFSARLSERDTVLSEVARRAGELELLISVLESLAGAFAGAGELRSAGLQELRDYVNSFTTDPRFQNLRTALPEVLAALRQNMSITVGINLDEYLRPVAAILLSVNQERFSHSGLWDVLLGRGADDGKGIAPLHTLPNMGDTAVLFGASIEAGKRADPQMVPLFRDLADVLERMAKPVARRLQAFIQINAQPLAQLRPQLVFYTYAVALARRLDAWGLSYCLPEIAPLDDRLCEVTDAYNLQLALHLGDQKHPDKLARQIVASDMPFGEKGRIAIVTGPNRGGKTTYLQAVGQAQVLAQAGLFVPGKRARISPVTAIYSHFPIEEQLERGTGRFGDEARRIRAIFDRVDRHSLVLLNETLATTNAGESLFLARDLVRLLRRIGLRAVYTTHLHELAADVGRLNEGTPGDSAVLSMAAVPVPAAAGDDGSHPYQIVIAPPAGRSDADRIAHRYGIGLDQLAALLTERGVIAPAAARGTE